MLLAAHAQMMAGATDQAQALLDQSLPDLSDAPLRAQAMRMQGVIRFSDGRGGETPSLLFQAAMGLQDTDPRLAREVLMEALEAAMWAGRLTSGTTPLAVAQAAREMPGPDGDDHVGSLLLTAYTRRLTDGYPSAVDAWRRAIGAYADELRGQPELKWDGLVWNATGELLDFEGHYATAGEWARVSREQGALATLPGALNALAWCEVLAGRIEAAETLVVEAEGIARATGAPATPGASEILKLGILCWRGDERKVRPVADGVAAEAVARGQGLGITIIEYLLTILELGLGRYEEARLHALRVFEEDVLWFGTYVLADVVEATARSGDADGAEAAQERLRERAQATRTPWALGLLADAMLASDDRAENAYRESLDHLGHSGLATELARTHLLYGEWLRRLRRRRDARVHLRAAHQMFGAMGAAAFAQRARVELLATGEHARVRAPETRDQLTPQEQQIARLAAEGESNAQIAAQLFISPHTVAYHLHKVFGKLDVSSRNQLSRALGDQLASTPPYGLEPRAAPTMVES